MQKNKLHQWIENINLGKTNQEVLFINATSNNTQCNLSDLEKIGNSLRANVKILWLDGIQEMKYRYFENQIVVIVSHDIKYFELLKRAIARGVIYLDEMNTINKTIDLLQGARVDVNTPLSYTSLQKMEFEEVLSLDRKSLEAFIITRDSLIKNIYYGFEGIDITLLNDYLTIYYSKKVLLANFASYLYRLAALDLNSTVKSVGATVHKILGVESKIINLQSLKIRISMSLLKNNRVYQLNENQLEKDIKIDIAKKLVLLDSKKIDVSTIANITELPLKSVEKMYRACFIR